MATDLMGFLKFSDGTMGSFLAEGATESTATAMNTGGNGINQVSGVAAGQAFNGKVAVAGLIIAQTDSASTGKFSYGYLLGPDGKIVTILQGGDHQTAGLMPMKPTRLSPGFVLKGAWDALADAAQPAHLSVECTDGTSDVFLAGSVADTPTELVNKDGNGIGKALVGKTILKCFCTYSASNGVNDDGGGFGAIYIQSSDGQLKLCIPPGKGGGENPTPWMSGYGTRILQNDVAYVNSGV